MANFDYDAPADVYMTHPCGANPKPITYRRFEHSAQAIRFVVKDLTPPKQRGTVMEVGDQRFEFEQILELYSSEQYPLVRDS